MPCMALMVCLPNCIITCLFHVSAMGLFGSYVILLLLLTDTVPPTAAYVPKLCGYSSPYRCKAMCRITVSLKNLRVK